MSELPPEGTQIILFATRLTHESSPAEVSLAVLQLLKRLNGKQGA